MDEYERLSHPKWECKYPVVFHSGMQERRLLYFTRLYARGRQIERRLCRDDGAMMNAIRLRCAIFGEVSLTPEANAI